MRVEFPAWWRPDPPRVFRWRDSAGWLYAWPYESDLGELIEVVW